MTEGLQRGLLLMGQSRHAQAIEEFGKYLGLEPNDAHAHALIALCLSEEKKFKEAAHHSAEAIRLAPDFAFAHYAAAHVFFDRNRMGEALAAVTEAIRLDPYEASQFALLAQIHLHEKRHEDALQAAEAGLEVDAEDVTCQNMRAMALKNLGRHMDAAEALEGALAREPENAWTHANKGWALLEKGKHEEALQHFQEALRIDPTLEWAREGIVTALKGRYKIYAIMLKYFLWMSKLSGRAQWGVILGVYFVSRMLAGLSRSNPELAPLVLPLRALLMAFVLLTWLADPLFNLALRMNKYGQLALSRKQVSSSNLIGTLLGMALVSLLLSFVIKGLYSELLFFLALAAGVLVIPASAIHRCTEGWPRRVMAAYTIALATVAAVGMSMYAMAHGTPKGEAELAKAMAVLCFFIFLGGSLIGSFGANILMSWRTKH